MFANRLSRLAPVAAALTLLFAAAPAAAATTTEDVRAAMDAVVAAGAPGVAATWTDGQTTETYSAGVADLESGEPISEGDHYRIASQTKTWTATIILKLASEGRLKLSDTVGEWLPGQVRAGGRVTIRQLLSMTSGYNEYLGVDGPMVLSVEKYPELAWQPKQLVAIGSSTGLLFTPGTEFLYSNTNFVLLTMIAKQASGKSLGQLLRAKVIEPLGLDDTTYKPGVKDIPSPFVSGYTIESGDGPRDATFTSPTIAFGAGAVVSTQRDVRRFFSSLIAGRLLPEPWLRKMQASTPQSFAAGDPYYGYGLGLEETIRDCGTTYGHAGGFPGYMSHTDVTPDARGSFTIYTNSSPKIGSTAPFPPEILANLEHAKDVLRCAIQAR